MSLDPLSTQYPHNSPYAFAENRVIDGIKLEGLEYLDKDKVADLQYGKDKLRIDGSALVKHFKGISDYYIDDKEDNSFDMLVASFKNLSFQYTSVSQKNIL